MIDFLFYCFFQLDRVFWGYLVFLLITCLGFYFTIKTRFFQLRAIPSIAKTFYRCLSDGTGGHREGYPLKNLFTSGGGMIGVGNVVGIVTAVQMGGPGALFWVWIAALVGTIVKYCEIFLGLKHRVATPDGEFNGGPMGFLRQAFKNRWIPLMVSVFLCIYAVDIYQFTVITHTVSSNWHLNHYVVVAALLAIIIYSGLGGVKRITQMCSWTMPLFLLAYIGMGVWVLFQEASSLPAILANVVKSAFTGHAAVGGFAGSSAFLAIQHGISRAAYSADIGSGYDAILQSDTPSASPVKYAQLSVLGVCIDNIICTLSILIVLVTGVWNSIEPIEASELVQVALSYYFPHMDLFMPTFLFVIGYTTTIIYFCIGARCARFLYPKRGAALYFVYAISTLLIFSFFDQTKALLVMSVAGGLLLMINLCGIFCLRHQVHFSKLET